jgi:hypothetical protein
MRIVTLSLAASLLLFATPTRAQEKPPEPPADDAAAASAKKAREVLVQAAAGQNAGDLAEPGVLQSLHIVFHAAEFQRQKEDEKGQLVDAGRVAVDEDGLVVDWMQGSVRTQVTVDSTTSVKGWFAPMKVAWIFDGKKSTLLAGDDHRADYDQLQRQRRIIDRLAEVAILGKLAAAPEPWRVASDTDPKFIAIERVPAQGLLPLLLRVARLDGGKFGDVIGSEIASPGAEPQLERFAYDAKYPKVRRKDASGALIDTAVRFPFVVDVEDPPRAGETAPRNVFHGKIVAVEVNTLKPLDFAQPKPPK